MLTIVPVFQTCLTSLQENLCCVNPNLTGSGFKKLPSHFYFRSEFGIMANSPSAAIAEGDSKQDSNAKVPFESFETIREEESSKWVFG